MSVTDATRQCHLVLTDYVACGSYLRIGIRLYVLFYVNLLNYWKTASGETFPYHTKFDSGEGDNADLNSPDFQTAGSRKSPWKTFLDDP